MPEKNLIFHFFHERSYTAESLDTFEEECSRAAEAGAKYIYITDIPKRYAELEEHPGDPYPNWGMLQTSLFKLCVPDALEPYLDKDYAAQNLELLRQRSRIASRYGLKSAGLLIDPYYLPEAVYRDHPAWRGPRCEHPRRAREMYFAPCIDHPEVVALYGEAMKKLCRALPDLSYLQIITNDSGAGLCWSDGLYYGANGPSFCRHKTTAERVIPFLDCLSEAAEAEQDELFIDITGNIYGYKAAEASLDAAWEQLKPGQLISGRNMFGETPVSHMLSMHQEQIRSLQKLPMTVDFIKSLREVLKSDSRFIKVVIHPSEFNEYIKIIETYQAMRPRDCSEDMLVLRNVAQQIVGESQASKLLEAWCALDDAAAVMSDLHFDNFVWMPLISQRLINRPFVPVPSLLRAEEKDYYRPYLLQAVNEEQAEDLMNIQGMDFVRGFTATRILRLSVQKLLPMLKRSAEAFETIETADAALKAKLDLSARRVRVLGSLAETLMHAALYQEILDTIDYEEEAAYSPVWPREGDRRLYELNSIARAEADNAYRLAALLGDDTALFFPVAEKPCFEDVFLLSENLPDELRLKAEITLRHMPDAEPYLESKNK